MTKRKGLTVFAFSSDEPSYAKSVASGVALVHALGGRVERIEPDHLVSQADIAERASISKASISLYNRAGSDSDFPLPVARVTSSTALWDWCEVADWLRRRRRLSRDEVVQAHVIRAANDSLPLLREGEVERFACRVELAEQKEMARMPPEHRLAPIWRRKGLNPLGVDLTA